MAAGPINIVNVPAGGGAQRQERIEANLGTVWRDISMLSHGKQLCRALLRGDDQVAWKNVAIPSSIRILTTLAPCAWQKDGILTSIYTQESEKDLRLFPELLKENINIPAIQEDRNSE